MKVNVAFVCIAVLGILTVVYFFRLDQRRVRLLKMRVKKMYASPMFEEFIPFLKHAQKRTIEQLVVDKEGVVFRFLEPAGTEMCFSLRERGYRLLSPEKQETLVVLMEEFLPKMIDQHRYSLKKKRVRLLNGQVETYYQYTILNHYKSSLLRAPYYNKSVQRLW